MNVVAALCRELTADRRHDGELLAAFVSGPSEDAFTEIVRRHGPLVWGACRRLLPDPADAEDSFQAAFLVLVRRARRLTRVPDLAPWLHRVAVWTARNARRKNARRLARQTALPDHVTDPAAPPDPDLKADLDAALLTLPARYRDPIVLCHLVGLTRREAAERLGCPEGTLSAWLNRGLEKLRYRLRGLDPARALAGVAVAVPAALATNTPRAAVATLAAGAAPVTVSFLVEGVLHMLWMKKATAATFALCAVFAMGVGVGLGTRTERTAAVAQDNTPGDPLTKVDVLALTPEQEKELAELDQQLTATETARAAAADGVKVAAARLELLKRQGATPKQEVQDAEETLARFQANLDVATERLKALKNRRDSLRAAITAKAAPPDPKTDADVAKLQAQIDAAIARQQAAIQSAKAAGDQKTADKFMAVADEAAVEAKALKDKLAALKAAKKAPPGPTPGAKPPAAADIEAKLLELKKQLDVLQVEREKLEALKNETTARTAELETLLRKLMADAKVLEAKRAELAGNPGAAAKVAHLEVTVSSKNAVWPCRVREFGADGKPIGSVIAEDLAILTPLFTRAAKDANGPKEVKILIARDAPTERVRAVLEACKAAGFQRVSMSEPMATGIEPIDPMRDKPRSTSELMLKSKAELDELIRKLEAEEKKRFPNKP